MKQKLLTLCTLTLLLALSGLRLPAQTLAVGSTLMSAENNPYLVPPTPEAAAFLNYGQYSVSQASGQVDVSIPIYEIRTRELTFPVSLSYIGGGVRVTDKASWAGLGWVLNAGGVVNLTVNGLPDKSMNPELPTATKIRADKDAASLNLTIAEKSNGLNGTDKMRDRYDYTMGKTGGSFYITGYNNYLQVPYTENRIRRLVNSTGKLTAGFVITDDSGTSYYYEQAETSTVVSTVWRFEIPDRHGRQVMTGLCRNTDVESIRSVFVYASLSELTTGETGYAISNLTLAEPEYLTISYYDSYDYRSLSCIADSLPAAPAESDSRFVPVYDNVVEDRDISVVGQLTGKRVRDVAGECETLTSYWYDELDRPVRTASHDTGTGITDEVFTNYNIAGRPTLKKRVHLRGADTVFTETQAFGYDRTGRLVETFHAMNDGDMKPLLRNVYDDVGRLVKTVYGESLDSLSYSYNIRNLPTSISGTDFSQNLYYNIGPGTRRHNGFVSAVSWKVGGQQWRGYKYGYDSAGHLTSASYGEGQDLTGNGGRYDEMFPSYDLNGNLLSLKRTGQTGDNSFERVDDLTLEYDGNHLVRVGDAVATEHPNRAYNRFNGGSQAEVQYEYDVCGNLVHDDNRGLSLSYNHLSLPDTLSFGSGGRLVYGWDAEGRKRSLTVEEPGKEDVRRDYFDGVIYRDGVPEMLQTATGYYSFKDGKYRHFIKDYLGSVRLVRNEDGAVEEINSYYPSGALLSTPVPDTQPYKYSGKERIGELGLGWHDFGARHYDPVLMRWHTSDVRAEKSANFSPYAFCLNNPVNFVDPDGRFPDIVWDLFSVGLGVKSFADNVKAGNVWGAVFDAGGIVVDVVAAAVPLVPGGVGAVRAGIKAAKAADAVDDAVDAARAADKALDAAKTADRVDNATDVAKSMKRGPKPNGGDAKPHGNADHNKAIDEKIVELKQSGKAEEIRKNQAQVDYDGNKVGNNRPDVQWNTDGVHHNYEVDRTMKNSDRHKKVIEANDPKAEFEYELIIDGLTPFDRIIK